MEIIHELSRALPRTGGQITVFRVCLNMYTTFICADQAVFKTSNRKFYKYYRDYHFPIICQKIQGPVNDKTVSEKMQRSAVVSQDISYTNIKTMILFLCIS